MCYRFSLLQFLICGTSDPYVAKHLHAFVQANGVRALVDGMRVSKNLVEVVKAASHFTISGMFWLSRIFAMELRENNEYFHWEFPCSPVTDNDLDYMEEYSIFKVVIDFFVSGKAKPILRETLDLLKEVFKKGTDLTSRCERCEI